MWRERTAQACSHKGQRAVQLSIAFVAAVVFCVVPAAQDECTWQTALMFLAVAAYGSQPKSGFV
jgi:hypothetical protein